MRTLMRVLPFSPIQAVPRENTLSKSDAVLAQIRTFLFRSGSRFQSGAMSLVVPPRIWFRATRNVTPNPLVMACGTTLPLYLGSNRSNHDMGGSGAHGATRPQAGDSSGR